MLGVVIDFGKHEPTASERVSKARRINAEHQRLLAQGLPSPRSWSPDGHVLPHAHTHPRPAPSFRVERRRRPRPTRKPSVWQQPVTGRLLWRMFCVGTWVFGAVELLLRHVSVH